MNISAAPSNPSAILAGRYRVLGELGRGGMGVVYLVERIDTGEQLALKLLLGQFAQDPGIRARFQREMEAPARIGTDHVVRILDMGLAKELQDAPFLVMERLDGCDLERLLSRGPLSAEEVVWLLRQTAIALDAAHAAGIVHRDLKPGNLFLHRQADCRVLVKVLDFGIAKLVDIAPDETTQAQLTGTGALLGTLTFMAPEQILSQPVSPATDQWALGLIAFRLLTRQAYWPSAQLAHLVVKIAYETLVPPSHLVPSLPRDFDAWFLRSCARSQTGRWPSVGAQVAALAEALLVSIGEAPPAALLHRLSTIAIPEPRPAAESLISLGSYPAISEHRPHKMHRASLVASAAVVLTLGLSLSFYLRRQPQHVSGPAAPPTMSAAADSPAIPALPPPASLPQSSTPEVPSPTTATLVHPAPGPVVGAIKPVPFRPRPRPKRPPAAVYAPAAQ